MKARLEIRKPTYHHAERVLHCSVEGEEDSIEVFTPDAWLVISIRDAEVIHRDYRARSEGYRWHRRKESA